MKVLLGAMQTHARNLCIAQPRSLASAAWGVRPGTGASQGWQQSRCPVQSQDASWSLSLSGLIINQDSLKWPFNYLHSLSQMPT